MIGFIKQFFGQSLIYIISPQLPRLLGFFMLPIITQYVTQTDYGVFANIMAFNLMFSYLVNFGFTVNISSIYVNNLNWKKEWGIYFVHNQVLAFLISIIQGVIFYYFFKGQLATNLWYVLFLTVIPNCFFQVTSPFGLKLCQLNQHSTLFGYVAFVSNLCMVLTNIYLVVFQSMGYFAWVIGNFVCLFLQFIGYGYYLFKIGNIKLKASFELNQFLKTLQQTWPSFLYVFTFFLLTWSDRLILQLFHVPIGEIGKYSVAYIFANYVEIICNGIGIVLGAAFLKMMKAKQLDLVLEFINWLQGFFVIGLFAFCLFMKEISSVWIQNPSLNQSYLITVILIFGFGLKPMYWLLVNKLIFDNKSDSLWKFTLIAGLINILLNVILVPYFGIFGSGIATLLSLIFMNLAGFVLTRDSLKEFSNLGILPKFMLWLIAGTLVVFFQESSVLLKLALLFLAFVLLFFFFKKYANILKKAQTWF